MDGSQGEFSFEAPIDPSAVRGILGELDRRLPYATAGGAR